MTDEQPQDDLYERFKKMLEDAPPPQDHSIFMNPRWRNEISRSFAVPSEYLRDSDSSNRTATESLLGMPVHYSPFIETGTAYIVQRPTWRRSLSVEYALKKLIEASLRKLTEDVFLYGDRRYSTAFIIRHLDMFPNALDNPDVRWEYQKMILSLPIAWFMKLVAYVKVRRKR